VRILLLLVALTLFILPGKAEVHPISVEAEKYFQQKNYDSALILYREVTLQQPQKKEGYYNQGLCLYYSGKYEQAIALFDTTLTLDTSTNARLMKALSLEKTGRLEEALKVLEQLDKSHSVYYTISKRIHNQQLATFISRNWYYMIALLFITVVFMVLLGRAVTFKGR
jgi:tetratricopeptide (TPR) repeat protein